MKCRKIQEQEKAHLQLFKKKKVQKLKEKGITLIALVVTIIILLILAGVTLNMALSGDGLFSKAKLAVNKYNVASEQEVLQQQIIEYQMDNSVAKIGEKLSNNSTDNPSWTIIKLRNENKQYGTNYNYVKEGTEIEGYGTTKYNWVINYENGEVTQLDDYIKVSSGEGVSVTENLELNINPKSMANLDTLGSGVTFVNGKDSSSSGEYLKDSYIEFDGIDDYLRLDGVKVDNNGGITFEIFGKNDDDVDVFALNKTLFEGEEIALLGTSFRSHIYKGKFSCSFGNKNVRW